MQEKTPISDLIPLPMRRRTASRVLAAAALEMFPGTKLIEGGDTPLGFYYDFQFSFEFREEFLVLVEEKMRQIAKEEREIQVLEMMPRNAAEFLRHHQLPQRAESAKKIVHSLTEVIKMGTFIDLCPGGVGETSRDAGVFKLQEHQVVGNCVRIYGTSFADKQSLKGFLKRYADHAHTHYEQLGKDLGLFYQSASGWIWSGRGECLRQVLIQFWKESHEKQNFHIVHSASFQKEECHLACHDHFKMDRIAEIWCCAEEEDNANLLETSNCTQDLTHLFSKDLDAEITSSLQFMLNIYKMFDFEVEFFLLPSWKKKLDGRLEKIAKNLNLQVSRELGAEKGDFSGLELRVADNLGRKWPVAKLEGDFEGGCLIRSLFLSLERTLALLLERHEGNIPFWLSPEQARIIPLQSSLEKEGQKLLFLLKEKGIRAGLDSGIEKLGKRVHNALQQKIPFCILVGEKVVLKDMRLGTEQEMDLMTMTSFLQELNRKETFENK